MAGPDVLGIYPETTDAELLLLGLLDVLMALPASAELWTSIQAIDRYFKLHPQPQRRK